MRGNFNLIYLSRFMFECVDQHTDIVVVDVLFL